MMGLEISSIGLLRGIIHSEVPRKTEKSLRMAEVRTFGAFHLISSKSNGRQGKLHRGFR
jgi:hypothetical protein